VIDAIESGAIERGMLGPGRTGAAPGSLVEAVERLQAGADTGAHGHGAGPVGRLLTAVACSCDDTGGAADREFRAALLAELVRRYLRAVRAHGRGTATPRAWQVVLDRWAGPAGNPARTVLAGAYALVGSDLAPAVVSACTLLGRTPGRAEQAVVHALVDRIVGLAEAATAGADTATRADARGLAMLLSRSEGWQQTEHLWSVRGRPSEAAKERAALDWRAELGARALLGTA
jgi:hypothetical protein